jgi:Fe-S cluster assembly protein SufD
MNKLSKNSAFDQDIIFIDKPGNYKYQISGATNATIVLLINSGGFLNLEIELIAVNSQAQIFGFVNLKKSDSLTIKTNQNHIAPGSISNLLIKSILNGNSSFSYHGKIEVKKDAQKTDAYQRNENLLLSKDSHVVTSPILEIKANDVRCTHGAFISSLPEEQLWYLKSRGISGFKAQKLLTDGFMLSALPKVSGDNVRQQIANKLEKWI